MRPHLYGIDRSKCPLTLIINLTPCHFIFLNFTDTFNVQETCRSCKNMLHCSWCVETIAEKFPTHVRTFSAHSKINYTFTLSSPFHTSNYFPSSNLKQAIFAQ